MTRSLCISFAIILRLLAINNSHYILYHVVNLKCINDIQPSIYIFVSIAYANEQHKKSEKCSTLSFCYFLNRSFLLQREWMTSIYYSYYLNMLQLTNHKLYQHLQPPVFSKHYFRYSLSMQHYNYLPNEYNVSYSSQSIFN